MGYTDAQGRPELTVNPRIKLGLADYRTVSVAADSEQEAPMDDAGGAVPATGAAGMALPTPTTARRRPVQR